MGKKRTLKSVKILKMVGLLTLALALSSSNALTGHAREITAAEKRKLEIARQLQAGLKKLKVCKRLVRKCNRRPRQSDDITCRDEYESCFEDVYVDYPQVEQYE